MSCTACGSPNVAGAKFCPDCGASLASQAAPERDPGEIRQSVERLVQAAAAAREVGQSAEAEEICREALKLDPNNASAHSALALLLEEKGDKEAAAAEMDEVLRLHPDSRAANTFRRKMRRGWREWLAGRRPHPAFWALLAAIAGFLVAFFIVRLLDHPKPRQASAFPSRIDVTAPSSAAAASPTVPQVLPVPPGGTPANGNGAVDSAPVVPGGVGPFSANGVAAANPTSPAQPQTGARTTIPPVRRTFSLPPIFRGPTRSMGLPPVSDWSWRSPPTTSSEPPGGNAMTLYRGTEPPPWSRPIPSYPAPSDQAPAPGPAYITLSPPPVASTPANPPEPVQSFSGSLSHAQDDYAQGDYERAVREYKVALRTSPSVLDSARVLQQMAMAYGSMGASREANGEFARSQQLYQSLLAGPNADLAREALSTIQKERELLDNGQ